MRTKLISAAMTRKSVLFPPSLVGYNITADWCIHTHTHTRILIAIHQCTAWTGNKGFVSLEDVKDWTHEYGTNSNGADKSAESTVTDCGINYITHKISVGTSQHKLNAQHPGDISNKNMEAFSLFWPKTVCGDIISRDCVKAILRAIWEQTV